MATHSSSCLAVALNAVSKKILIRQRLCIMNTRCARKPSPPPAKLKKQRGDHMALTRNFKQTVIERVERDPEFAKALLDEAATLFLSDEPETARLILRDLVNATVGFEQLAVLTKARCFRFVTQKQGCTVCYRL